MKLLFIGPLKDMSGYARASRNFLLSLIHSDKLDVAARAITYDSGGDVNIDPQIEEAMKVDINNIDFAVQMTTSNVEANPIPGVVNGLYTFVESNIIPPSWAQKANCFDFVMVACKANAEALFKSGVSVPVVVLPVPCDKRDYENVTPYEIEGIGDRTVFYNVCQLSTKKGIDSLLRSYYAAFADKPDEVALVLKCYIGMNDRSNDEQQIKHFIQRVKEGCRIPIKKYPPVIPILENISDNQIQSIHAMGGAYVCSSRGEGWGMPVFDALSHGNTVISNTHGGLEMFVSEDNALIYNGTLSHAFDMNHPDPLLYTGMEVWFEPSTAEMSNLMRGYHMLRVGDKLGELDESNNSSWQSVLARRTNAKMLSSRFDFEVVSERVVDVFNSIYKCWKSTGKVNLEVLK